jgi:hypothetical protein
MHQREENLTENHTTITSPWSFLFLKPSINGQMELKMEKFGEKPIKEINTKFNILNILKQQIRTF